jgi:predicted nucleotidyltransferase
MKAEVVNVRNEDLLIALCKKNDIVFLGVFGSYSRGSRKKEVT